MRKLPPYAGWVLVGSAALMAATAALGYAWIGGAGLMIGWVLVMLLSRHSGTTAAARAVANGALTLTECAVRGRGSSGASAAFSLRPGEVFMTRIERCRVRILLALGMGAVL